MSTETLEIIEEIKNETNGLVKANEQINQGLVAFENKKSELTALAENSKITIAGIDDKENIKKADAARKLLKAERVQITKDGKSMRDQLTVVSRKISEKEKELIGIISPVEDDLQDQLDKIEAEKERLRQIEIEKENQRIQERINALNEYGYSIDFVQVKGMTDEQFNETLQNAKSEYEAEQIRKAAEEKLRLEQQLAEAKAREEEQKKLEEERAALEIIRKQQEEAAAKIRAEQEKLEAEKRAIEAEKERQRREEEIKKAREEAAEAARVKAIEDAKEAERLKKEAEEKARIEAEEKAAQAPDKVKIQKYINAVKSIAIPELKSKKAKEIMSQIQELISRFDNYSTEKVNTL